MQSHTRLYKHSGAMAWYGPVYIMLGGLIGVAVLGNAYGLLLYHNSIVILNVVATACYGVILGLILGEAARLGKVRSPAIVTGFALGFGLIAIYASWVSYLYAASYYSSVILTPTGVWHALSVIAQRGFWNLLGWTPRNLALYIVWVVEAATILLLVVSNAVALIADRAFCESCKRWVEQDEESIALKPVADVTRLLEKLHQDDVDTLQSLEKADGSDGSCTLLTLLKCPACQATRLMNLHTASVRRSNGKFRKLEPIIENYVLSPAEYARLRARFI